MSAFRLSNAHHRDVIDATCPVCRSAGVELRQHARDRESWTCFRCESCALEYWSPRAIDPAYYADAKQVNYARRRQGEVFLRERHLTFLERTTPGRLFDVGCGEGGFLDVARSRGFEVAGIDLDRGSIEIARQRGIDASTGLLFDERGELASPLRAYKPFDRVTAFEVLEHQAEPLVFLAAVSRLLASDGVFCGSVPNRDRYLVERDRRYNSGDLPPHHFLYFSAKTLRVTLERAGFRQIEVFTLPEADLTDLASYVEVALTGGLSRRARSALGRSATRTNDAEPIRSNAGRRAMRAVKNVPFYPIAAVMRRAFPHRGRSLYFEAKR